MEILDNVIKLLKQSKKIQKELMHYLGVNPNVFSDWKTGRNQSYMKYLPKIAEYFNVSIDTLTG